MRVVLPEGLSLEGPGLGDLDVSSGVDNGLSDLNELSDDNDVVEISKLEWFSLALQEAQH